MCPVNYSERYSDNGGSHMQRLKLPAILAVLGCAAILLTGCPGNQNDGAETTDTRGTTAAKPVIYLYPTDTMQVSVTLDLSGQLTCTYPGYADGWDVTAKPDGMLTNQADGKEYSYLYWEGVCDTQYDFSKGFVVKGQDTAAFLQAKLSALGLTAKEYNEFIVYWLPQMQDNPYNLISFQGAAYTDTAVLDITPEPDSLLRVFMAYKPLEQYEEVEPQVLPAFEREGFTVVEWGGSCVEP